MSSPSADPTELEIHVMPYYVERELVARQAARINYLEQVLMELATFRSPTTDQHGRYSAARIINEMRDTARAALGDRDLPRQG